MKGFCKVGARRKPWFVLMKIPLGIKQVNASRAHTLCKIVVANRK
jgi:hypothetical protein